MKEHNRILDMGLFSAKTNIRICDVCSSPIRNLFATKLGDGYLCANCRKNLSPYYTDLRRRTVDDVKMHLTYREDNKGAVDDFYVTKVLFLDRHEAGVITGSQLYLDEQHHKFLFSKNKSYKLNNPDVFDFKDIRSIKRDSESSISSDSSLDIYEIKVSFGDFGECITESYALEYSLPEEEFQYRGRITEAPSYKNFMEDIVYAENLFDPIISAVTNNEPIDYTHTEMQKVRRTVCPNCGAATAIRMNRLCEYCGISI